jgi:hypothetical protein
MNITYSEIKNLTSIYVNESGTQNITYLAPAGYNALIPNATSITPNISLQGKSFKLK